MPVQIEMAKPADLAGEWLRGVQTAGQLRVEQQRIAQQERENSARLAQDAQRLEAQAQRAQEEANVQRQRIAVASSYNQQKAALRKQQLDQVAKVNAEKTQSAARQFEARQRWDTEFARIDADENLSPEEKDAEKARFTMRLAPLMGIPGTEAASMLRELRPQKPTVPATVTDRGDFMQVTQPTGQVSLHPKPRAAGGGDPSVRVVLEEGAAPVTMPKSQALRVVKELPPEVRSNPVNIGLLKGAVQDMQAGLAGGTPAAPSTNVPRGTNGYATAEDVKKAYQAGKLTREQAKKILMEQFGHQ